MTTRTARGLLVLVVLAYIALFCQFSPLLVQDYPNHLARATVMADLLFRHGAGFGQSFRLHLLWIPYVSGDLVLTSLVEVAGTKAAAVIWGLLTTLVGVSTLAKFSALVVLVGASFALGGGHGASLSHLTASASGPIGTGAMGLALVSVLWAYDGWGDLSFASGEVKEPQRNLPRAIILGTLALIAIYVLTNVAYLYVIPITGIANPATPLVAADTMMALFGQTGVVLVSVFVMISSFSSLNGSMLASPRVFFAMADDGLLFRAISKVHARYKTPYVAILLAALLGMGLVMSRSFERLTDTFVLAIWPFYALGVAAIYRLRRERPELPRPYRAVGYPIVPAVFIASVAAFVINSLVNDTMNSAITFAVILAGLPVYSFAFDRRAPRA